MDITNWNTEYKDAAASEILKFAYHKLGDEITLACSFSMEDVAILDILASIEIEASVFVLDTGRLPEETYEIWQSCQNRYKNIDFTIYTPQATELGSYLGKLGPYDFYNSVAARKQCCQLRKVEPLGRALAGKKAWITGMRSEHSVTRSQLEVFATDAAHAGMIKINPLCHWNQKQLDHYVLENKVPIHPLHLKGFPSIGCAPCTRAISPGEDMRAGRWWWENAESKECGLHSHNQ